MALAQQLAELALANEQGMLNDDEYRLLRQNLFEQHSSSTLVPVESFGPGRALSSHRVRIVDTSIEMPASKPSLHRKDSFTNLLKRGSVNKTSTSHPADAVSAPPAKRGLIPRLHKKARQLFSSRTGAERLTGQTGSIERLHAQHQSNTPLQSSKQTTIPTFPSTQLNTSYSSEIFDDRNLYTVKDIRAAIIATEAEAQRLLEAFNNVKSLTSFRVTQQNARRLRAPTPEHVTTVMNGSNWRKYTPAQFSPQERKSHYPAPTVEPVTDDSSVRSNSPSIKRTLSRSKSISSLRSRQNLTSPLSARISTSFSSPPPSILRKSSMSSISSQARFGVISHTHLSQSNGHLPLRKFAEGVYVTDVDDAETADTESHPEVFEIQRRRDEVVARYNARLEYLQARLKSAELHEWVSRR
ncbi:hypothetical protein E4T56_gene7144 [Termitomyces sp. T112]|nr:hypothetical protein E4T56_gene7144 [Termitomyces sp. T112]